MDRSRQVSSPLTTKTCMTVKTGRQTPRLVVTVETESNLDGNFHGQRGGDALEMVPIGAQVVLPLRTALNEFTAD